jgi:hypothetical protein
MDSNAFSSHRFAKRQYSKRLFAVDLDPEAELDGYELRSVERSIQEPKPLFLSGTATFGRSDVPVVKAFF